MQIKGRTFIISGGSSGLGLATAVNIVSNGGYASIFDLNPPSSVVSNDKVLFLKTDVSSTVSLKAALQKTLEWTQSTSASLSGVICCAGIGTAAPALPRQTSNNADKNYYDIGLFDRTIAINLRGTVDLIRLAIPHLADNTPSGPDGERGLIIIVSSVAAYEGQVGQLAYSASKGAVASTVLPLARELGRKAGIRVMGVAPGVFETGMTSRPKPKAPDNTTHDEKTSSDKKVARVEATGSKAGLNPEMSQYPRRMGRGDEFASLVQEIIENTMLNGFVIRLDGAVRMPSRL